MLNLLSLRSNELAQKVHEVHIVRGFYESLEPLVYRKRRFNMRSILTVGLAQSKGRLLQLQIQALQVTECGKFIIAEHLK